MSKSQAEAKRDELLAEVNARNAKAPDPHITFGEFLEGIALPVPAVQVEAVNRRNHGEPHSASSERRIWGEAAIRSGPQGTAIVPQRQGRRSSPAASWRICAGICGPFSSWRLRKDTPTATRRRRSSRPRRQRTSQARVDEQRGGGTLHRSIGTTRARYRASCPLRRHAPRRDSGACSAAMSAAIAARARIEQRLYRGDIDTPKTTPPPAPSPFRPRRPSSLRNGWSW